MRRYGLAVAVLAAMAAAAGADDKAATVDRDKLVGGWEVAKSAALPVGSTVAFAKDGTFAMGSKVKGQGSLTGTYAVKGDEIALEPLGLSMKVKELGADKLVLVDPDGQATSELKRMTAGAAAGVTAAATAAAAAVVKPAKAPPDGWKAVAAGGGRAFVPQAVTAHQSTAGGRDVNGVRAETATETYSLAGGVELSVAVVAAGKDGGKAAKPFAPFQAADKKAGGTPGKMHDFDGEGVKGRSYANETKDHVHERKALFQAADGRIYVLTVACKDKGRTEDAAADLFLKSLSWEAAAKPAAAPAAEPKKADPKKVKPKK